MLIRLGSDLNAKTGESFEGKEEASLNSGLLYGLTCEDIIRDRAKDDLEWFHRVVVEETRTSSAYDLSRRQSGSHEQKVCVSINSFL
jgi:hypothetical protein